MDKSNTVKLPFRVQLYPIHPVRDLEVSCTDQGVGGAAIVVDDDAAFEHRAVPSSLVDPPSSHSDDKSLLQPDVGQTFVAGPDRLLGPSIPGPDGLLLGIVVDGSTPDGTSPYKKLGGGRVGGSGNLLDLLAN